MAGMYRAKRNEGKELVGKAKKRLRPEDQVKHWKRCAGWLSRLIDWSIELTD
jgi:hypothetical protein